MTADIEKLKALALAANNVAEAMGQWLSLYEIADGITIDALAEFIEGLSPAAVLELITDNERLRAEKEAPDSHVIPPPRGTGSQQEAFEKVLTDEQIITAWDAQWRYHGHEPCKLGHLEFGRTVEVMVATRCRVEGGNTIENASAGLASKGAETRMDTGFCAGAGSAPAAGTDKDAERYRLLTRGDIIQPDDEFLSDDCTSWLTDASGIFAGLEYLPGALKAGRRKVAAIEAHTNKESTK